jgi:hypothetical protein
MGECRAGQADLLRTSLDGYVEDVRGRFEWAAPDAEEFKGWNKYVGKRPRVWGPWTESTMPSGSVYPDLRGTITPACRPQIAETPRPRPGSKTGDR